VACDAIASSAARSPSLGRSERMASAKLMTRAGEAFPPARRPLRKCHSPGSRSFLHETHSPQIRDVLQKSDRVTLLEVDFPELVADPQPQLERLAAVLGERFTNGPAVAACVKPGLHRHR